MLQARLEQVLQSTHDKQVLIYSIADVWWMRSGVTESDGIVNK